jgi:carboxypeptidase C (cathepsin A)
MRQAEQWAVGDYARALARRDSLSDAGRDSVIRMLARFTGIDASLIDRRTLTVNRMQLGNFLLRRERKFVGQYDSRLVGPLDTAQTVYDPRTDPSLLDLLDDVMVLRYLRNELGYKSDLRYQGPWGGGYPPPATFRGDWMSVRWNWGVTDPARDSTAPPPQPLRNAMRMNPSLRVFSACGIYDLVCDYYGNVVAANGLDAPVKGNVVVRSYAGGHAMYTDPRAHIALRNDVVRFIRDATNLTAKP